MIGRFARRHSLSPEEESRSALFENIGDGTDLAIAEQAWREYLADGKHSRPISEKCK